MWIEKIEKNEYQKSAKLEGLRCFYEDIGQETIIEIKSFIKYIRKNYYFPIRCKIFFTNESNYKSFFDGHRYYGIFFDKSTEKRKVYPQIYVASKITKFNKIEDVLFTLLHELTHYYQWYFYEEKIRTNRSLEIEANKWARYILQEYKFKE